MRVFFGIDLDDMWRDALSAICQAVREVEPSWRDDKWVPVDNLHLTLKFCGEMPTEALGPLEKDLAEACSGMEPFMLPLDQPVVPVPQARRATMLWSCFQDPESRCTSLASTIEHISAAYGIAPETREFKPHITLVRARRPRKLGPGRDAAGHTAAAILTGEPSLPVSSVTLFSSKLTRSGAAYDRIASAPFEMR